MWRDLAKRVPGARRLARAVGLSRGPASPRRFLLDLLPTDAVGAEVGVHLGGFSAQILEVARPRKLYLIDPWIYRTSGDYTRGLYGGQAADGQELMDQRYHGVLERFDREVRSGRVVVLRATSTEALSEFPDDGLDWIYIDGDHTYAAVAEDLTLSLKRVRPGGLICGDDYGRTGWWGDDVTRAVDEFSERSEVTVLELREGQFALRRDR
jgi:hypothetical protein